MNLKSNFFNRRYEEQIDGVDIGSPLGSMLIDIFVQFVESKFAYRLSILTVDKRYVNAVSLIANFWDKIHSLYKTIDNMHRNIRFTII